MMSIITQQLDSYLIAWHAQNECLSMLKPQAQLCSCSPVPAPCGGFRAPWRLQCAQALVSQAGESAIGGVVIPGCIPAARVQLTSPTCQGFPKGLLASRPGPQLAHAQLDIRTYGPPESPFWDGRGPKSPSPWGRQCLERMQRACAGSTGGIAMPPLMVRILQHIERLHDGAHSNTINYSMESTSVFFTVYLEDNSEQDAEQCHMPDAIVYCTSIALWNTPAVSHAQPLVML